MATLKAAYNGVPCEIDLNNSSSASRLIFTDVVQSMRAVCGKQKCGYCGKEFHFAVIQKINGKIACPDCKEKKVPGFVAYMDKHKQFWR